MKQYCRYCANCTIRDEDVFLCLDEQHQPRKWLNGKQIRRQNSCKHFLFNEIAVDDLETIYKPREKKDKSNDNQLRFII